VKKENVIKISVILLIILVAVFLIVTFVNKNDNPQDVDTPNQESRQDEFNETGKQLAQNHFNFVRIFEHLALEHDYETGKVTDTTYSSYADFEKAIKDTYSIEYANSLLNGDDAVYYNKDGNLYVNIDNASYSGIYTGNGDIIITVKNQTETKVDFEAKIKAFVDPEGQDISYVIFVMVAEKQEDNSWKLTQARNKY